MTPCSIEEWEIVCGKQDIDMGYICSMTPHHDGKCYSKSKKVYFDGTHIGNHKSFQSLLKYIPDDAPDYLMRRSERLVEDIYLLLSTVLDEIPTSDFWDEDFFTNMENVNIKDKLLEMWGRYNYIINEINNYHKDVEDFKSIFG